MTGHSLSKGSRMATGQKFMGKRRRAVVGIVAAAAAVVVLGGVQTAGAAVHDTKATSVVTVTRSHGQTVFHIRRPNDATTITCVLKTNNPHYSSGAGGVIAKATTLCTVVGTPIPATVVVNGFMNIWKAGTYGPYPPVGENTNTYAPVPYDVTKTMYMPASSKPGLPCHAGYKASAYATIVLEGTQIGSAASQTVTLTC
jgi:hypothetical protein